MRWLLRMSRWARDPPSGKRVVLVLAVLALCLTAVALERLGYWPDWATSQRLRR